VHWDDRDEIELQALQFEPVGMLAINIDWVWSKDIF